MDSLLNLSMVSSALIHHAVSGSVEQELDRLIKLMSKVTL